MNALRLTVSQTVVVTSPFIPTTATPQFELVGSGMTEKFENSSSKADQSILSNPKLLQTLVQKSQHRAGKFENRLLGPTKFHRSCVFMDLQS